MKTPAPQPGIYPSVPFEEYAAWDALNISTLKKGRRSMAHLYHALQFPDEPTDAMAFGTAFHTSLLEGSDFASRFVVEPQWDKHGNGHLTKDAKSKREEWSASIGDRTPVDFCDAAAMLLMRDAVREQPLCRRLLDADGQCEVCAVWVDQQTGVVCKGRMDKRIPGEIALDLKTCDDASPDVLATRLYKLGYHNQVAWYQDGFRAIEKTKEDFVILAVEKDAPHCVAVYQCDNEMMALGRMENRVLLLKYVECAASGVWPGYSNQVEPIGLPRWVKPVGLEV